MLEMTDVTVRYTGSVSRPAVDRVSLRVAKGETVGLVGESGSGKSSLARSAVGLVRVSEGSVILDGLDVTNARGRTLETLRSRVQMIFQDPRSSLNPKLTVGSTVLEAVMIGSTGSRSQGAAEVEQLFTRVGLDLALVTRFPHQLSGGQLQRGAIARALARRPEVLLLDEITASLDVSVQALVLNLLRKLQKETGISMLYISHDLSVVRYLCERAYVMQGGVVVEDGSIDQIFERPTHEYTRSLLAAVPVLGGDRWRRGRAPSFS